MEGLNFVLKGEMTKREYLDRYRRLVRDIFAPQEYFERIVRAVLALRRMHRPSVRCLLRWHFRVFLREVYHLGVRIRGSRILYWKALLRVLWKNPDALEAFGHDCFYYYHLTRHAEFVHRQLGIYLSSPDEGWNWHCFLIAYLTITRSTCPQRGICRSININQGGGAFSEMGPLARQRV